MKIIYITNGNFSEDLKNFNCYQRAYFLSEKNAFTLVTNFYSETSDDIKTKCNVVRSKYKNKLGFLIFIFLNIKLLQEHDIIITEASTFSIIGIFGKIFFKKKWILDIWDIPFRDLEQTVKTKAKRTLQIIFFRPILQQADLYLVSIIPDYQLMVFKLNPKKMKLYTNAIFLDEYNDLPSSNYFSKFSILIQRSVYYKGFGLEFILKAFELVANEIDVNLIIVGELTKYSSKLIRNNKYAKNIITTGFIKHGEFITLASKAHVCAIPYPDVDDLKQIYPIKAIEFMALGKAIVYTNIDGLKKIIGEAGFSINNLTPESFASALMFLYQNKEIILDLEKRAYKRSSAFDASTKNISIEETINDLASQ